MFRLSVEETNPRGQGQFRKPIRERFKAKQMQFLFTPDAHSKILLKRKGKIRLCDLNTRAFSFFVLSFH